MKFKMFFFTFVLLKASVLNVFAEADFDVRYFKNKNFPLEKKEQQEKDFNSQYGVKLINRKSLGNNVSLPSYHSLRDCGLCGSVDHERSLDSCTAQALSKVMEIDVLKTMKRKLNLSRLFIYYNSRSLQGNIDENSGVKHLLTAIKSIKQYGAPLESMWPYKRLKRFFKIKPYSGCYVAGKSYKKLDNQINVLQQNETVLKALLSNNVPIAFGMLLHESFLSKSTAKSGIVKMPTTTEKPRGGHAAVLVGYDDKRKMFLGMNSWGKKWGDKGYFHIPYKYVLNPKLCCNFYVLKPVGKIQLKNSKPEKSIPKTYISEVSTKKNVDGNDLFSPKYEIKRISKKSSLSIVVEHRSVKKAEGFFDFIYKKFQIFVDRVTDIF